MCLVRLVHRRWPPDRERLDDGVDRGRDFGDGFRSIEGSIEARMVGGATTATISGVECIAVRLVEIGNALRVLGFAT